MSSMGFSEAEKKAGRIWVRYFEHIMTTLKAQGKINPSHVKEMRKFFRIYNFANQSAIHANEFDGIVRNDSKREKFLKTNPDIVSDILDEIWYDMLIVSTLRCYWGIEISLITMLKDVQYGRRGIVEGRENLGRLKDILDQLGFCKYIDWTAIDVSFRNALAHGWYYRKKQIFVYYTNSKLKRGKKLTRKQLIMKCRMVQIYALVISGLVGKWWELEDFGSKDPLKKLKK